MWRKGRRKTREKNIAEPSFLSLTSPRTLQKTFLSRSLAFSFSPACSFSSLRRCLVATARNFSPSVSLLPLFTRFIKTFKPRSKHSIFFCSLYRHIFAAKCEKSSERTYVWFFNYASSEISQ